MRETTELSKKTCATEQILPKNEKNIRVQKRKHALVTRSRNALRINKSSARSKKKKKIRKS